MIACGVRARLHKARDIDFLEARIHEARDVNFWGPETIMLPVCEVLSRRNRDMGCKYLLSRV